MILYIIVFIIMNNIETLKFIIVNYTLQILFVAGVIYVYFIFKIEKEAKKWYAKNKISVYEKNFFMLKDRVNNIY